MYRYRYEYFTGPIEHDPMIWLLGLGVIVLCLVVWKFLDLEWPKF